MAAALDWLVFLSCRINTLYQISPPLKKQWRYVTYHHNQVIVDQSNLPHQGFQFLVI